MSGKIAQHVAAAFNMVAVFRGDHWKKTAQDCLPLAQPVAAYVETLPKSLRDSFEKYAMPLTIVLALVMLLQEPIQSEFQIIARERSSQGGKSPRPGGAGLGGGTPAAGFYQGTPAHNNGNGTGPTPANGGSVRLPNPID